MLDGLREKPKNGESLQDNHMVSILQRLFPNDYDSFIHGKAFRDRNGKPIPLLKQEHFRPDFYSEKLGIVIEIDGDSKNRGNHYSKADVVINDNIKDRIYKNYGYEKVVRIPPFVQLDSEMIKFYFNIQYNESLYEAASCHGFAHQSITLPADFCELGILRFEKEMKTLPQNVRNTIIQTLKQRIAEEKEKGYSEEDSVSRVLPSKLRYLLI